MKKLLLLASSVLLFSCSTNEEIEKHEKSTLSETKIQAFKKASEKGSSGDPVTFKCGSTSYINPINVNPNYPYINNYEVLYKEGTPMWGRNQIYLDKFVAEALFPSANGPFPTLGPTIYYGYNAYGDFLSDPTPYDNNAEYSYGQDADNASFYGDIFPYNAPMTNDAANTVYHHFKTYIDQWTSQGKHVVAVHIFTESYLCIPAAKGIRIRLKFSN
ncbi:Uncharacterised protein [Chryseobacterium gleum]|uniref:Uncharacterized protein n=2 Tax=Chryseobacterium gleum TaxID=250 RepID=A0A448AXB2_CHRGE|nr:hypothetical protein [Chryseobacterium gleum]EFK34964.1 hypothetical protein HMPREF0204_14033 [Chryseobacterium gleum ATCC 35910]QBJ85181.1 hypothetical protein DDI74_02430 [Chryseobacterium gleum]QQY30775.1 hypothetical protein I6I60_18145 [Chryseobacterium gleum]VEE04870.1 Uncharacterised protein [Chryseobacterium gleum]